MALAAQGVAQAKVGQLQLRRSKIARPIAVGDNLPVGRHSSHALAAILAQVGLFQAEKIAVGIGAFEAAHHLDRLVVLGLAAQK